MWVFDPPASSLSPILTGTWTWLGATTGRSFTLALQSCLHRTKIMRNKKYFFQPVLSVCTCCYLASASHLGTQSCIWLSAKNMGRGTAYLRTSSCRFRFSRSQNSMAADLRLRWDTVLTLRGVTCSRMSDPAHIWSVIWHNIFVLIFINNLRGCSVLSSNLVWKNCCR